MSNGTQKLSANFQANRIITFWDIWQWVIWDFIEGFFANRVIARLIFIAEKNEKKVKTARWDTESENQIKFQIWKISRVKFWILPVFCSLHTQNSIAQFWVYSIFFSSQQAASSEPNICSIGLLLFEIWIKTYFHVLLNSAWTVSQIN